MHGAHGAQIFHRRVFLRAAHVVGLHAAHPPPAVAAGSRGGRGTILVETGEAGQDGAFLVDPHVQEPNLAGAVARIAQFESALKV